MISVIMPVYNGEKYIKEAIESVLKQSCAWELIIIDDGSTDRTFEVIYPFLEDDRIQYRRNEQNLGVAKSRNRGIFLAKGEYVAFLDADDRWREDKLEKQLKLLNEKNAVLCSTARALMDEKGKLTGKVIPVKETIRYKELLHSNRISMSSAVLKREVALEFPMGHDQLHEDYILWLQVLKRYGIAYGINEPLLEYRLSPKSKSGNKWKSAKMTFGVYRYMGFGVIKSICYFCSYAVHGVLKYL